MKHMISMITIGLIVLSLSAHAQELTIACEENLPPFSNEENGTAKGAVIEVVQALLQKLHRGDPIMLYPWARVYNMGLEKENTLICAMTRTPARESLFKWAGEIVPSPPVLLALKNRQDIHISTFEDVKQYKIGTLRSAFREKHLLNKGLVFERHLDSVSSYRLNYLKLKKGRIDLWSANLISAYDVVKKEGDNPEEILKVAYTIKELPQGMELAFNKNTPDDIVDAFRDALDMLKQEGTYDKIISKYLP